MFGFCISALGISAGGVYWELAWFFGVQKMGHVLLPVTLMYDQYDLFRILNAIVGFTRS